MAKKFKLSLNTPEASLFDGEAEIFTFNSSEGEVSIMADHTPLLSIISPGVISIKTDKEEHIISSGSGFLEVTNNTTKAYIQSGEFAESIDEKRAVEATQRAKTAMAENQDEMSLADATSILERNIARLKTLQRKKRKSI